MADIRDHDISYEAGDTTLQGYLAWDAKIAGPRPGVLLVHEWWGLNDYIRGRARQLAVAGYAAFAVDMYGNGKTADNPTDANTLMTAVLADVPAAEARFAAARASLAAHEACDASRMAAIGYCFGGAVVLHAARIGTELAGVVSFHGSLGSMHKAAPGSIRARVLACHGAADQFVPDDEVNAFKQEMAEAGADLRFVAYEGALHGFTNPQATANGEKYELPLAYDAEADQRSWAEMQAFFAEIF